MNQLSANWFIEGKADAEYKQYILLAYLQHVADDFRLNRIYPDLSDLIAHYQNLNQFLESKNIMMHSFPGRLTEIDLQNFRLAYEKVVEDDHVMQEIMQVVEFSLPLLKTRIQQGQKMYDFFEEHISVTPVGIIPLYKNDGYILVKNERERKTNVYVYQITIFETSKNQLRGIHTHFLETYELGLTTHYEGIKKELVAKFKQKPNPATFAVETEWDLPLDETILPIAKRKLVSIVSI